MRVLNYSIKVLSLGLAISLTGILASPTSDSKHPVIGSPCKKIYVHKEWCVAFACVNGAYQPRSHVGGI